MSTNKAKLEALLKLINSAAQQAIAEYEKAGGDAPSIDSTELHPLDSATDQVVLRSAIRTLEGACARLCTTLAPPSHTAIDLVEVYHYACVRVAIRENITDVLMNHPKGIHVNSLSTIVNVDPKKLARLLRLLVSRGCYTEVETDFFANNRVSLILHSKNPVRHVLSLHVEAAAKGAAVLYESLKDSEAGYSDHPAHAPVMYANNKEGITGTFFDWIRQEDAIRESYNQAMMGINSIGGYLAVLTHFPFEKYSTVVDIGGGIGAFSLPLAKTHKHIKITIHDLPETLVQTRRVWENDCPEAIHEYRVEFADLDFFAQVPVKGKDIYYLRNIIHDWPDRESILILRNVRQALGPHSRVLIHDNVLHEPSRKRDQPESTQAPSDPFPNSQTPEPPLLGLGATNSRMYHLDLMMLIIHNARERTLQDFLDLSTAAGLKLEKVWDLVGTCVLEFSPA